MKVLLFFLLFFATPAYAIDPQEQATDPTIEAHARALFQDLRCLVCQNESIDDSDADLARDLRAIVRDQIKAGQSDADIKQYLVQRYGEFILLKPRIEPMTYVLWFGPVLILVIGGVALYFKFRSARTSMRPKS